MSDIPLIEPKAIPHKIFQAVEEHIAANMNTNNNLMQNDTHMLSQMENTPSSLG